jgi:amino acid adenylation domain-containing protein
MSDLNAKFNPFAGPELDYVVYTTKAQSEIWIDSYLGGKDAARAYNLSFTMEFDGLLDSNAMERAIQKLVERHESLRATFSTDGVYMSIFKELSIELAHHDFSNLVETEKDSSSDRYIKDEVNFLFDLVHGPLIKFGLLKFSNTKYSLIITVHHIISDGWSIGVMIQELGVLYSAYVENKIPELAVSIPFSIYANEEKLFTNSEENKEIEKYWIEMYKHSIPILDLPTDNPRPSLRTYKSQRLDFTLDSSLLASIKKTGLSVGASFVTTLLSSFEVFLYQQTGQDDFAVGLPSAGQLATGMNHLIGHCVNLLPLRSKPSPNISFLDYLKVRKSQLLDDYSHQKLSFGHLLQKLNIGRDPSRIPLVPVVLNIDMGITDSVEFSNLSYKLINNPKAFDTFEIFLNVIVSEKNLVFECSYNKALFKPETIKQMVFDFEQMLKTIVEDPSKTLKQITFQDYTSDYNKLNDTAANYHDVSLKDLFILQVQKTPNKIALEFLDKTISYKILHEQTNQLAHYLKAQGVESGDFIAVSFPRSPELIFTLLAIIQCGAAYLPLDPEYPKERLEFMLEDSNAKVLLTSKLLSASLPTWSHTLFIEDAMNALNEYSTLPLPNTITPDDIVYLLYTSGSTGKPKGVPITHKNLVNFLCSMTSEPGINENDRLLSITTISFDIAGLELYLPLIKGATLILADHETARDGRLLLELIKKENISFLQATPTTWYMLLDAGWSKPLPLKALCGGEAMPIDLAKELVEKCDSLWNMYGPTETTIWSSVKQIKADDTLITIGKPIANTQFYILNEFGHLMAPGNIGEIAIGGDGVAKGYWKRPELSAEKFIKNEFLNTDDGILYRTGDLGKILPNNEIECLGRVDQQVKIRGHRIEPGEVEQTLIALDGIKYAVVLANENFLVAHIVPEISLEIAVNQIPFWRTTLTSQLPPHLVPHDFNLLEKMPTTLNGKIDRNALLQYKTNQKQEYTAPRTEEEKIVAAIWKECLNLENIDIFSNFFEIGGHSLIAVKVMSKIEKETGERLPLASLFEHSSVEKFAKLLKKDSKISTDCLVPLKAEGNKVPLYIIHGAGLNVLNFINLSKHFDEDQPIYGIQGNGPKGFEEWYESIEDMASHYIESIIKTNPNGPYALAGFSFGGIVAFEMTRQLKEQGKIVSLTAMLDSYVDSAYYYPTYKQKQIIRYLDRTRRRLDFLLEMLISWKAIKLRINAKKEYLLKKYFGFKDIMTEQEALALEEFIIADSMVSKIVDRYHLIPQDFQVDLFRAKDDSNHKLDATHLGWKKAALKGVHIHNIPGDHLDIVAPPNDKILARMLQNILDQKHNLMVSFILIQNIIGFA